MRLFVVGSEYVVCCARVTRDTNKDKRRRRKGEKNFSFKIKTQNFYFFGIFF